MLDKVDFLSRYNYSVETFDSLDLEWTEMIRIHDDYQLYKSRLESTGKYLIDRFISEEKVHSVRFRLKDPEHLIEKIIRKKIDEPKRIISLDNYKTQITDLIGIRIIHLFKEDWITIHKFIVDNYSLHEKPIAYYREGDSDGTIGDYKLNKCKTKKHKFGYRSVHYLIKHTTEKHLIIAEVQVRTIFEEAWSEIDHRVRYPNSSKDLVLEHFLRIFNRLSGSSDEMGSFVVMLKKVIDNHNNQMTDFNKKIAELEKKIETKKGSRVLLEAVESLKNQHRNTFLDLAEDMQLSSQNFASYLASLNENRTLPTLLEFDKSPLLGIDKKNIRAAVYHNKKKDSNDLPSK